MKSLCVSGGIVGRASPPEPRVAPLWRVGGIAGLLGVAPPATGSNYILTEAGDFLVTEGGDRLVTE